MKDNKKLLIIMTSVLLAFTGLLILLMFLGTDTPAEETADGGTVVVKKAEVKDITAFTLKGTDQIREFKYTDSGWVYNGMQAYPLSPDFIHTALESLSLIDAVKVVVEGEFDPAVYGLSQPQMTVSYVAGGEHTFLIGDYNSHSGWYYMCESGGDTVFLIDADLPALCGCEETELISPTPLPENYSADNIKRISIDNTEYTEEHPNFSKLKEELGALQPDECERRMATEGEGEKGTPITVYYSGATEDEYGTAVYTLELRFWKGEGVLFFTFGSDGVVYRLYNTDCPELAKVLP